jgi:hypothetical protein
MKSFFPHYKEKSKIGYRDGIENNYQFKNAIARTLYSRLSPEG